MSEQTEQDRSELPSQFKLDRARREGNVARGMDLGFLGVLAALTGLAWFGGEALIRAGLLSGVSGLAATDAGLVGVEGYRALAARLAGPIIAILLPMIGALFAVVVALEFLQTGPVFSTRAFRLDFSRLNPATGLKRLFSVRILIETAKGLLKLGLYTAVAAVFVVQAFAAIPTITDASRLGMLMGALLLKLFAGALGVAGTIAVLDQLVSRRQFLKQMRMSRREVKREHKDREGDPRLKQKRKELHGQFAKTSQSLKGVRDADLIIVNPVHFAVALRYRPGVMDAPVVVSRGSHAVALRLRRLAFAYGVPVIVDPPLARRLFRASALNRPLPDTLFRPVADIYLGLRRQRAEKDAAVNV